jgi:multidrug efflux system membrane fusion protein
MRAIFPNKDNLLVPGLFARVQIESGSDGKLNTNALLITERAIGTDQSRKFVYVIDKENKAEYREVVLGQTIDGLRIVRSGLKPGEKIVVNGLQRVRPGAQVSPEIVGMDAEAQAKAAGDGAKG